MAWKLGERNFNVPIGERRVTLILGLFLGFGVRLRHCDSVLVESVFETIVGPSGPKDLVWRVGFNSLRRVI